MKKVLSTLAIMALTTFSMAQTAQEKVTSTPVSTTESTSSTGSEALDQEKINAVNKEIAQIDSHLKSIEIKRQYILADPVESKKAEENGWFDKMKATEERLLKRKEELQQRINQ